MAKRTKYVGPQTTRKKKTLPNKPKKTVTTKKPSKNAKEVDPVEMLKSLEGTQELDNLDAPIETREPTPPPVTEQSNHEGPLELPATMDDDLKESITATNNDYHTMMCTQTQLMRNSENLDKKFDKILSDLENITKMLAIIVALKPSPEEIKKPVEEGDVVDEELPMKVIFK